MYLLKLSSKTIKVKEQKCKNDGKSKKKRGDKYGPSGIFTKVAKGTVKITVAEYAAKNINHFVVIDEINNSNNMTNDHEIVVYR
ncbi:hypothetical protein Glove_248g27 [Diversispora epigaea]|uniref:Uncharacterized protein n=1 Tax=Diversispora epigaea TaxID=1348612 RepID=A0A397ICI8_9GLOM|nr:hypothetical protein Glove_248g27 [Diversispora epigaea]